MPFKNKSFVNSLVISICPTNLFRLYYNSIATRIVELLNGMLIDDKSREKTSKDQGLRYEVP